MSDVAFEAPVRLRAPMPRIVRSVDEAAAVIRTHLRSRITMKGVSTLLTLEQTHTPAQAAEARRVFCSWAIDEKLLVPQSRQHEWAHGGALDDFCFGNKVR